MWLGPCVICVKLSFASGVPSNKLHFILTHVGQFFVHALQLKDIAALCTKLIIQSTSANALKARSECSMLS